MPRAHFIKSMDFMIKQIITIPIAVHLVKAKAAGTIKTMLNPLSNKKVMKVFPPERRVK